MKRFSLIPLIFLASAAYAADTPATPATPGTSPGVSPDTFVENETQRQALLQLLDAAVKNCGIGCTKAVVFFQDKLEAMRFGPLAPGLVPGVK